MDDLLTTREVQGLLSVDRMTMYRILKNGRLHGIKIRRQGRFHRYGNDVLLGGQTCSAFLLPTIRCQPIQDSFDSIYPPQTDGNSHMAVKNGQCIGTHYLRTDGICSSVANNRPNEQ